MFAFTPTLNNNDDYLHKDHGRLLRHRRHSRRGSGISLGQRITFHKTAGLGLTPWDVGSHLTVTFLFFVRCMSRTSSVPFRATSLVLHGWKGVMTMRLVFVVEVFGYQLHYETAAMGQTGKIAGN